MGPNTRGKFHAGWSPHRLAAAAAWSPSSGESEPAKSTCLAMNWFRPAPEPVGLYESCLPWQSWLHVFVNSAIAFCCAVDPSADSESLPPQSTGPPFGAGAPTLLSLPHADAATAMSAAAAIPLSFIVGQRMRSEWT